MKGGKWTLFMAVINKKAKDFSRVWLYCFDPSERKKKKRNKDGFYVFPVTTYHDLNHLFAGRTFPKCI